MISTPIDETGRTPTIPLGRSIRAGCGDGERFDRTNIWVSFFSCTSRRRAQLKGAAVAFTTRCTTVRIPRAKVSLSVVSGLFRRVRGGRSWPEYSSIWPCS